MGAIKDHFDDGRPWITAFIVVPAVIGTPAMCEPDACLEWRWFWMDALPSPLSQPFAAFVRSDGWDALAVHKLLGRTETIVFEATLRTGRPDVIAAPAGLAQPPRQPRRRDDHQLRRRARHAHVEQLVQPLAVDSGSSTRMITSRSRPLKRRIDSNRTSSGSSGSCVRREALGPPVVLERLVAQVLVAEPALLPHGALPRGQAAQHGDPPRRDALVVHAAGGAPVRSRSSVGAPGLRDLDPMPPGLLARRDTSDAPR